MIQFLLKGILRDKRRSRLPIIIIAIGVMLTVVLSGYLRGAFGDIIRQNANFDTGHVKVMTRAYADNKDQFPVDLAILGASHLMDSLENAYPELIWVQRTRFGGLIDAPDGAGGSRGQGPVSAIAIDFFSDEKGESDRMNIHQSLVSGEVPRNPGEAIIGHDFAQKLQLALGDTFTFMGSTMNGSLTFHNFTVAGTIRFGNPGMDKGATLMDISDAQKLLDMEDGTSEILGFLRSNAYSDEAVNPIVKGFNAHYAAIEDEFAPVMVPLREQNNMGEMIDYSQSMSGIFIGIFVLAMSIVLWNTGLLGGLRRYKEFGIRLALGESKGRIYRTLIMEATIIGIIGSILGTAIGLGITWYLQVYGIDISQYMDNSSMLMPAVIKAQISPGSFVIGFIPGVLAMVLGNMLSGYGIYKRQTASLFKELEI